MFKSGDGSSDKTSSHPSVMKVLRGRLVSGRVRIKPVSLDLMTDNHRACFGAVRSGQIISHVIKKSIARIV